MKALSVARKSFLELLREPLLLGLLLFFPAVFVGFYYIAFGQTAEGMASYLGVLILDEDGGQAGAGLVEAIRQAEWDGAPIFDVEVVAERRTAEITLRERKASLLLVIPPDLTATLQAGEAPALVALVGDPGSDSFVFAHSFLNWLVREFATQVGGWQGETLTITYEFLPGTGTMSDFDFGAVGIIVFGIMFLIVTSATALVRENVGGTLQRLRLSRAGAADLLIGVTLSQMAAAALQMPLTLGAALAMGLHSQGSLLLIMVIGLLLSLSAVGLGLIVACFARNDGDAVNLSSAALVPMIFLSDALYPMPVAPLFTIAGRTIEIYDLLPATHASEAMRRVLIFGDGPAQIAYELVALTVLSGLILAAGVLLYRRLRLQRD